MPPVAIAAGVVAAGAVGSAAISSSAASKAAKAQASASAQQQAAAEQFRRQNEAMYAGDVQQGDRARDLYAGLLGDGGDAAASQKAYDTWRNSASYQSNLNSALDSVNSNAYAQGYGRSGAVAQALQKSAADVSNGYMQTYLGNLNTQVTNGLNAKGAIAASNTTALNSNNQAVQANADAQVNSNLASGLAWSNALQNVTGLASKSKAFQSSFGGGK